MSVRARVSLCVCVFLLYVGYEKAGTAEFSTQEYRGGNGAWIILPFRSSGTRSESTLLNQYCSKLSHVPLLTSLLLLGASRTVRFRRFLVMMLGLKKRNSTAPSVEGG